MSRIEIEPLDLAILHFLNEKQQGENWVEVEARQSVQIDKDLVPLGLSERVRSLEALGYLEFRDDKYHPEGGPLMISFKARLTKKGKSIIA